VTTHPTPNLAGYELLTVRAIDVRPGDLLAGLGEWCTAGRNDDSTEGETSTRSIVMHPLDDSPARTLHILATETLAILRPPEPSLDDPDESVTSWHTIRVFDGPELFDPDKISRQYEGYHPQECADLPPGAMCWFFAHDPGVMPGWPDEPGTYRVRLETHLVGGYEEPDYDTWLVAEPLPHEGTHDPATCTDCRDANAKR
jgi:hypothetical protein